MAQVFGIIILIFMAFGGIGSCAYFYPQYNVYSQRMEGQAEFQRAESNRQIKVEEARADLEAAEMNAQAEVVRAKGVAAANEILSTTLGGPENYIKWRYIQMLENTATGGRDVVYVPTEAQIPIMEAGRIGVNR